MDGCDTTGQPCAGGIEDNLRSLAVDRLTVVNLRLMDDASPGQHFDDQLAAMVAAREDGLIGGIGLSNITPGHLRRALAITDVACVQNLLNLADRRSMPVLEECHARGIAFVPFFPLGSGFARGNPILATRRLRPPPPACAARPPRWHWPGCWTCGQSVLLIPGTSSISHLEENIAAANIGLDPEARDLLG